MGARSVTVLLLWLGYLTRFKKGAYTPSPVISVHDGDVLQPRLDPLKNKYMKHEDQIWILDKTTGYWALIFQSLHIETSHECQHDFLEIRELSSQALVRYCGEITPRPYLSRTSHVAIRFVTDGLWELMGFNITVIYAERKDLLEQKVNQTMGNHTSSSAAQVDTEKEDKDQGHGPLFFVLIGSCTGALVVFGVLLTYFVVAIRKQVITHETCMPKLYYISGSQKDESLPRQVGFVRLHSGQNTLTSVTTAEELCRSGKKRYSRNKKDDRKLQSDNTTYKAADNRPSNTTQHNNMYVSSSVVAERLRVHRAV